MSMTFQCDIHFKKRGRGIRKEIESGPAPARPVLEPGRVPRVARLMALALRFEQYLREGIVADYGELAELGQVSKARISQILNLLNLAPDLQEAILFLPRTLRGRDSMQLRQLQAVAAQFDWRKQRQEFAKIRNRQP